MRVDGERSRAAASHHCCESWRTVRDRDGPVRPCSTSISSCACAFVASRRDTPVRVRRTYSSRPRESWPAYTTSWYDVPFGPRRCRIDSVLLPVPCQIPCQATGRLRAVRHKINQLWRLTWAFRPRREWDSNPRCLHTTVFKRAHFELLRPARRVWAGPQSAWSRRVSCLCAVCPRLMGKLMGKDTSPGRRCERSARCARPDRRRGSLSPFAVAFRAVRGAADRSRRQRSSPPKRVEEIGSDI